MSVTRRSFLKSTTLAGAGLMVADALKPVRALAQEAPGSLTPYLSVMRMAATPTAAYRAYKSKVVGNPDTTMWLQIDLGVTTPVDYVLLFPASERDVPGARSVLRGRGFPAAFQGGDGGRSGVHHAAKMGTDLTDSDFPDPGDNITKFSARGHHARFVRLTVTRLRPVKEMPGSGAGSDALEDSPDFTLTLAKIGVVSSGEDVAVGCAVTADKEHGNPELLKQLTRPPREDGETIKFDHPNQVTDASTWQRVHYKAEAPRTGITLEGGLFQAALTTQHLQYLLNFLHRSTTCCGSSTSERER